LSHIVYNVSTPISLSIAHIENIRLVP